MNNEGKKGCAAVIIVIAIIGFCIYWKFSQPTSISEIIHFKDEIFWRGEVKPSQDGYLITNKLIPLRAIARRPNVPMYASREQGPVESFRQVMNPWKPYYVYEYDAARSALRIAEKARLREEEALWVQETEVYCWTTREVLNIEQPLPIYASLEDAKADKNRLKESYVFRYGEHVESRAAASRMPMMAALPVLRREEGKYWSFIRPDPEPQSDLDRPYQVCWVKWEGQDRSVSVRLRITRPEFEDYTNGLQKLLYDFRYSDPEGKATAHRDMRVNAQTVLTGEEEKQDVKRLTNTDLESRSSGIPRLNGILLASIQSELQANDVSKRLLECLKMGNDRSFWSAAEIAYVEVDRLP